MPYIVIPPFAHDGHIERQAISKHIPFFCEKPVGLNLQNCKHIVSAISEANLVTSSGYLLRYEPLFNEIKEIITRNQISTVRICAYAFMPAVAWWRQQTLSGGMMVEAGSHYIDLLRYLFGEVKQVAAFTASGLANQAVSNCDTYDSMEAILKFQSGIIASLGVTHLLNEIFARHDEMQIYGKDFALRLDLYQLRYGKEATVFYKEAGDVDWQTISRPTSKKALLKLQSLAFLEAVQSNNASIVKSSYEDAVKTLEVALAMNAASLEAVS